MSPTPAADAARANPFPGLRPFEAHETPLFFGRDGQSTAIIGLLERTRFVGVVGTSGSGKSSLVRAGLLPQLEGGFMSRAGSFWRFVVTKPGDAPIHHLAQALAEPCALGQGAADPVARAAQLEAVLRRGSLGLIDAVRQAQLEQGENVLVVVDQFEELFRMARLRTASGQDEAAAFVALLLEASKQTEVPIYVALTMRSDFLGDCAQFRDLPEALNRGQYLVPRMSRDERRAAIEGPVAVGGAQIAPRLVQQILNEVGDNPDQLPVMQHALMRTWEAWAAEGHPELPLDIPHYRRIGALDKALSDHAQEALTELTDPADQTIARRVFQRLCERAADYRETRRPTRLAELCAVAGADAGRVTAVIDRFRTRGRTFLVPAWPEALDAKSVIDISHEALIRQWGTLRGWVDAESESVTVYQRLAADAALHAQDKVSYWRDPQLRDALAWRRRHAPTAAWAQRYHKGFDEAMRFLDESARVQARSRFGRAALFGLAPLVALVTLVGWRLISDNAELERVNSELTDKQTLIEGQRRKLEEKTEGLNRANVELGQRNGELQARTEDLRDSRDLEKKKTLLAQTERQRATEFAHQATAGRLAVQSLLESDSESSTLLALEALRQASTLETQAAVWQALARPHRLAPLKHAGLRLMANSRDGRRLATVDRSGTVVLWDLVSGSEMGRIDGLHGRDGVRQLAISNGGDEIYTAGATPYVQLLRWTGSRLERVALPGEQPHKSSVGTMRLSPDGRLLATGDNEGQLTLWDTADGLRLRKRLDRLPNNVVDLAFDAEGKWLAGAARGGAIQVVATDGSAQHQIAPPPAAAAASASPFATARALVPLRLLFSQGALVVHMGDTVDVRKPPEFAAAPQPRLEGSSRPRGIHAGTRGGIFTLSEGGQLGYWGVAGDRLVQRGMLTLYRFGGTRATLPQNPDVTALAETDDEQLVAFVVRDPQRPSAGSQIVIGSQAVPGSATVLGLSRYRITGLAFAERSRMLLVSTDSEVLRIDAGEYGARTGTLNPTRPYTQLGGNAQLVVAPGEGGAVLGVDAQNRLYRGDARGATLVVTESASPAAHPEAAVPERAALALSPIRSVDTKLLAGLAWVEAGGRSIALPVNEVPAGDVRAIAASAAGRLAWAVGPAPMSKSTSATLVEVWDAERAKLTHSLSQPQRLLALALSQDGLWLGAVVANAESAGGSAAARRAGDAAAVLLKTWELLPEGRLREAWSVEVKGDSSDAFDLRFGKTGRWLTVSNRDDDRVSVFDWRSGRAKARADLEPTLALNGIQSGLHALSPDESQLVVLDRTLGVVSHFPGRAGSKPVRLIGSDADISVLAYSPDSRLLLGGARDGSIYIWDAPTGRARARLRWGHRRPIGALSFSADGLRLASGDHQGNVATWSLPALHRYPPIDAILCQQVGRNLDYRTWQTYLKDEAYRLTCPLAPAGDGDPEDLIQQAWQRFDEGQTEVARQLVSAAVGFTAADAGGFELNRLCYRGALAGAGREAMPLCERAVKADPDNPAVRDSRAVALALAGRPAEAIADLRFALADPGFPESARESRTAWLRALQAGRNPFDAKTLRQQREGS